jgi:methylmalonyl-CoA mutase cobalamin-binding subunit
MERRRVALVGAEYEENLSLRYLAAAVEAAGFVADIVPFEHSTRADDLAAAVVRDAPIVVGLSVPFQHHARATLGLAAALRARGYRGHITAGGHFATFEFENILRDHPGLDSVVRHEGEDTLVDLCQHVRDGMPVAGLPGLVARAGRSGRLPIVGAPAPSIVVGPKRPLPELDALPFPDRRGEVHDVLGVPTVPILGSRGCYADCSFCCIFAYADNALGARYRMRSPEAIAREMLEQYERRGVRLFVFHDDNFFVPDAKKNLRRYERLAALLRAAGMTDIGIVIKCRPNDVDPELFALLRDMGMIRAYVGIESNSEEGVVSLNRRITADDNRRAMDLLRAMDVYCSFNVLIFDPEATLAGIAQNLDFMAECAEVPFNFCRAEVYAGTPLKAKLEEEGRLMGDYLAWDYRMRDPRVELLFRVAMTAFYGRNFKPDGIANLNMGVRFDGQVLRRFYAGAWDEAFDARARALSRAVGEDSVAGMREALAFVQQVDPYDAAAVNAFTLALARRVSRSDLRFLAEIKALRREMERRVGETRSRFGRGMPVWAAETARLGTSVGRDLSTEVLPAPSFDFAGGEVRS